MMETKEGATAYEHALNHALEFFSKAGSLFEKRESFYDGDESALSLFQKTWIVDKALSMQLLLWLRDCRGGAGNRSGFRSCVNWLAKNDPAWVRANIGWIPLVGRWDDLRSLFGTDAELAAATLWVEALSKKDVLAAKWADRKFVPLRNVMNMNEADFRRYLAAIRKEHIVEHKMCTNRWNEIDYEHIPSLAMARYTKAFGRHDEERFNKYKEALETGEKTIHAGVLFPHDCVRTCLHGDTQIADAQFEALPNYMPDNERPIVICDTSGSMNRSLTGHTSGSIQAVHVSQGMALYCSSKLPADNPFYKKFIAFCSEDKLVDWNGMSFSEAVHSGKVFDGAIGATRIDKALNGILKVAKFFNLTQDQMPTSLIIVSDMQFHNSSGYGQQGVNREGMAEVETCMAKWLEAGYNIPKIVYWNTAGYAGQPATANAVAVGMVSGFSPAIVRAVFTAEDFTPTGIMMKALEKYEVTVPE